MSAPGSPYRWAILAVCVAGFVPTHMHRVGFAPLIPTVIAARRVMLGCMGVMALGAIAFSHAALAIAMFAQETGRRAAV